MKNIKRAFTLFMAIILMFTSLNIVEMIPAAEAAELAENVPTTGSTEVYERTGELLTLGEWQYYVENDVAIVAGYGNVNEETITIPFSLGGYPVAQIGHSAFTKNTSMREIRIHTNVTAIADDAFENLNQVKVRAYNGSYALQYAKAHDLLTEVNQQQGYVFTDSLIDMSGIPDSAYYNLTEAGVTIKAGYATFLEAGQNVYFPAGDSSPTELTRKIASITETGDELLVSFTDAEFSECVERWTGEEEAYIDWDSIVLYDAEFADGFDPASIIKTGSGSESYGPITIPIKSKKNYQLNKYLALDYSCEITIPSIKLNWDIESTAKKFLFIEYQDYYLESASLDIPLTASASAKVHTYSEGSSEEITKTIKLFSADFGGYSNYCHFGGAIGLNLIVTVKGEADVSVSVSTTYTISYDQNREKGKRVNGSYTKPVVNLPEPHGEAEFTIGPELTFDVDIYWGEVKLFTFLELTKHIYVQATGVWNNKILPSHSTDYPAILCQDYDVSIMSQNSGSCGVVGVDKLSDKITCIPVEIKPIYHLHRDGDHKVDECSLLDRTVEFDTGSSCLRKEYDVGDVIEEPGHSDKSGYTFEGWYVDTEKSGLAGSDYKLDFENDRMPYCGADGILYVYAKFEEIPPKKISLDRSELTGYTSDSGVQLNAAIEPKNALNTSVKWTSSNTAVATVNSNGKVSFVSPGTATIKCTSKKNSTLSASCKVTVKQYVTGVTVNGSLSYPAVGESAALTYTVSPGNASNRSVTWSSSNTSVATVDSNGNVTARGAGKVQITATAADGSGVKGSYTVQVVAVPVTGITLDKTNQTAYTNNHSGITVSAKVSPSNADVPGVTWSSSNTSVAKVDSNGCVTFVAPGTATITCKSVSRPGVTAACVFEVRQYAEKIDVDSDDFYAIKGISSKLTATVYPANTSDKSVVWSSSDPSIAEVSADGTVTTKSNGDVTFTATAADGSGVTGSYMMRAVTEIPVLVSQIVLSKTNFVGYTNNTAGEQLTATVYPDNADYKAVKWTSSDPAVAAVDENGRVSFVSAGTATVTCRSVSTKKITAQCTVTVKQYVEKLEITGFNLPLDPGSTMQLGVNIYPDSATDKGVTWSSSKPGVATVSANGLVTAITDGYTEITVSATDGSGVTAKTGRFTVGNPVKVPVESVTLDITGSELYTNNMDGVYLTATVLPEDAYDRSVSWTSSDVTVAYVTSDGQVKPVAPGTAVITCASVSDPEISAKCAVTVKQYVENVYISGGSGRVLYGETEQLSTRIYPDYASNKNITWSSSNTAVAMVDANGLVTAVAPGDAVITATAKDGGGAKATYKVCVEKQLQLVSETVNGRVYTQGSEKCTLATVSLSTPSMLRMAKAGYTPEWSMTKKSGSGDTQLSVLSSTVDVDGKACATSIALLKGSTFPAAGTEVYTVTCKAGAYTESVDISVTVDGGAYAQGVKLSNATIGSNSFRTTVGQTAVVPFAPISTDTNAVPSGLSLSIDGDYFYDQFAAEERKDKGIAVTFTESGIYTAALHYSIANLGYDVTASYYITDENGVVHVRIEDITLDKDYVSVVEGDSVSLTATVSPDDAYDKSLTWTSEDPSVAKVSENGVVSALKPGTTRIVCSANDCSGQSRSCTVNVQSYLQLDEETLEYTVYMGGQTHVSLDTVSVTRESKERLVADNRNVTWSIKKISGGSAELGLSEYTSAGNHGLSVPGNLLMLLRMNCAGTDEYLITCSSDSYSNSCRVVIHVTDEALPDSVQLRKSSYSCKVNEWMTVDTAYKSQPGTTSVPSNAELKVDGGKAFTDALSPFYSYSEPEKLRFSKAGTYSVNIVYSGTNYSYTCPVTVEVADEEGNVPALITDITVDHEGVRLYAGETKALTATVLPSNAVYSKLSWTSTDTSVATVSSTGTVTAIGEGVTTVVVSAPESDYYGSCLVYVEDGITFRDPNLERTVFIDGTTRMTLDNVMLTDNTSIHMQQAPEWSLRRVSGVSLTLKAEPYETLNDDGDTVYGCSLILYSVSKEGDTVYELTCTSGTEQATATVTVHAAYRDRVLPASIEFATTRYEAEIGELISFMPEITAYPAGTKLPNGLLVTCEGDRQFTEALNTDDFFISQSMNTLSFSKAGTYTAQFIYSYSNVKYIIPVTFGIKDADGNIPVQASRLSLSSRALYLTPGDSGQLSAVFTPVNASNQAVTWESTDPTVVSVSSDGKVKALKNGSATVWCIPDDGECDPVDCAVTVESPLTVDSGADHAVQYLQGTTGSVAASVRLSEGTQSRFLDAGLTPVWTVETDSVTVADLETEVSEDGTGIDVTVGALNRGGTETYTVSCTAGEYRWSGVYTLEVIDLGSTAPESVSIATPQVSVAVNEAVTIDFTPVMTPSNAKLPSALKDYGFIGVGDFYDAYDRNVYKENGDKVTVAFTKPGTYLLGREYMHRNLQYVTQCLITVGGEEKVNVLKATETAYTVYTGGRSGVISTVSLNDAMIAELWGNSLEWSAERISGDSLVLALKESGSSADVYVASVKKNGTDVWRVSCSFAGVTEYVDITVTAADPRGKLPESISLGRDTVTGMIGNWITVPLGVSCEPAGSMLPDQGSEFWSFSLDQAGEERSSHSIGDGMLSICFTVSGYYTGTLKYSSGNVSYTVPVYFIIQDEEEEVAVPSMNMYLLNCFDTVYPEGETGVAIGQAVMADRLSTYSTGSSVAYMKDADTEWKITTDSKIAKLALSKVSDNVYNIVLSSISASGDLNYTVSCTVNGGAACTGTGKLHVAADGETRPESPSLTRTLYRAQVGEPVSISKEIVSLGKRTVLKSSSEFDSSAILSAVGYDVSENDDNWTMTFYEAGEYSAGVKTHVSNLKLETPVKISVTEKNTPRTTTVLLMPVALKSVEESAFEGSMAEAVDFRKSAVTTIGAGAFKGCVNLTAVYLPSTVTTIADDAFYGCLNAVFYCAAGSAGAKWAAAHGFEVVS